MRWLFGSLAALAVLCAAYMLSPYLALYSLGQAIEARDAAALNERVNVRAVRASVARELVVAYLTATGRAEEAKGLRGQVAVGAGASLADRLLAGYSTPEELMGLLSSRRDASAAPLETLRADGSALYRNGWRLFATSEWTGFRSVSFGLPPDSRREDQYRLQFRVRFPLRWRLVGLQLPRTVEQRLVQEFIRSNPS